jgi:hypothetical protein
MLEQHRFPVEAAISTVAPLDRTPDLLRVWSDDPARFTKIMITFDQEGPARSNR